jgi:SAM-dependent methyltransferase
MADQGPLAALVHVFLFGRNGQRSDLDATLGSTGIEALAASGLVAIQDDRVLPLVRLTPFDGLILAHDREDSGAIAPEHVPGIGPAPRTLHALTIRTPVTQALDIGTGCGVQALCLARHAQRVIGTDVNPRALWLARCNAALNGIDNIEWREGSLLAPVMGEMFDLVVANPPFVISPDTAYVFRDAGIDGNVSQALLSHVHRVLRPGGYAQALINWVVREDGDWQTEPRRWISDAGCDAWLLHYESEDGLSYAAKWNTWLRDTDRDAFGAALDRWTTYYAEQGIHALATGAITLRRRATGPTWWKADHMLTAGPQGRAGSQVLRVFHAQDHLRQLSDSRNLLTMIPHIAADHRLEQWMGHRTDGYVVETTRILLDDGAGVAAPVDPQALLVLLAIDGRRPVADLLIDATEGLTKEEVDAVEQAVLTTLWSLGELGVVTFTTAFGTC